MREVLIQLKLGFIIEFVKITQQTTHYQNKLHGNKRRAHIMPKMYMDGVHSKIGTTLEK